MIGNTLGMKKKQYLSYLKDKQILERVDKILRLHKLDKDLCKTAS